MLSISMFLEKGSDVTYLEDTCVQGCTYMDENGGGLKGHNVSGMLLGCISMYEDAGGPRVIKHMGCTWVVSAWCWMVVLG